jgi:hypothetical protein
MFLTPYSPAILNLTTQALKCVNVKVDLYAVRFYVRKQLLDYWSLLGSRRGDPVEADRVVGGSHRGKL